MALTRVRTSGLDHHLIPRNGNNTFGSWRDVHNVEAYIIEGWGEGFMLGALLIMAVITISNMRRNVLLHKLILVELLLAMSHGTFCFMAFRGYGWYLSSTAALLYCSYFTHNVVAWMKIRPFFTEPHASFGVNTCIRVRWIYLVTLGLSAPVLIFEMFNNFRYFNNISTLYERVRPYEPLMRDPWWVFSCLTFVHIIRKCYYVKTFKLIRKSPRFGILLAAMALAIIFTIMDILASIVHGLSATDGINPYWKLALVFKSLTDNIMLDDFKSVLQRLGAVQMDRLATHKLSISGNTDYTDYPADDLPSRRASRFSRPSFTGRWPKRGRSVDSASNLSVDHSAPSSAIGRLGVKIRNLGGLPTLSRSAVEQQGSSEKAQDLQKGDEERGMSQDMREPFDRLEFITTWNDSVFKENPSKE